MRDITISIMDFNERSMVNTTTVSVLYEAACVFKHPVRLIAAYACVLAVSFVFILTGLVALFQNGTSTSTGGFLRIMSTTTHRDGVMNQLAKEARLKGAKGLTRDLSELKVRFSVIANGKGRYAAFRTVDETEVLLKGY